MITFANTLYRPDQVVGGMHAPYPPSFTGMRQSCTQQPIILTGAINKAGDLISARGGMFGATGPVTVRYDGYFLEHGQPVYAFTQISACGPSGVSFCVRPSGDSGHAPYCEPLCTGVPVPTCFLRGTRLLTDHGEAAIETLAVGDLVATRIAGATVMQPIVWIGRRTLDVADYNQAIDAYPVRIRAHAIADQVPSRDLLVTAEHCLFIDGRLIPARLLVNDASIVIDTAIPRYEYFHVELDSHAILIADGLAAESYLDTGNRDQFDNGSWASPYAGVSMTPTPRSWERDAAAPLAVDVRTVRPIWERLAARASAIGLDGGSHAAELVNDADLHLVTETDLQIRPSLYDGNVVAFVVPGGTRSLQLVSRASRPSDSIGPYVDDRRHLGVLIGRVGLSVGRRRIDFDGHLATVSCAGWHERELDRPCRWTNGSAMLPIDLSLLRGQPAFLDIEIVSSGPYRTA